MYRDQDSDNGPTPVQAAPVPEAQPINQAELTELQRAEAEIPASPPPAALPPPFQAHPARRPLWRPRGAPAAASLCSPRSCSRVPAPAAGSATTI
jgi:hypothetical protein